MEAVAVVSFREDLLAFLFFILSAIFYIQVGNSLKNKNRFYVLSLIFFSLALFSKEMAVSLPTVLILIDRFLFKKNWTTIIVSFKARYLGYFLVLTGYLWINFSVMKNSGVVQPGYLGENFYTNFCTMLIANLTANIDQLLYALLIRA